MSGNSIAFKSDKYCCYAGDLGNTWDRVGKAENCEEHPVRERERRLEGSPQLRQLEANSKAVAQLQSHLEDARAHRAKLIERALKAGHSRFAVADAAGITIRLLDAIRSHSPRWR